MKRFLFIALMIVSTAAVAGTQQPTAKKKAAKSSNKTTTVDLTFESKGTLIPAPPIPKERKQSDSGDASASKPGPTPFGPPVEVQLKRASGRHFDLRNLPRTPPPQRERVELEPPAPAPTTLGGVLPQPEPDRLFVPAPNAPAPPPLNVFEGLDRFNWGAGSPPDPNGDVGPTHYIQTVNTSIGVFRKSDGFPEAEFTFNTFMSQGNFGNLCDTNNFGDPVVLYDTFEDRWIITDFAFTTDVSGNVLSPSYQCIAASMTGDPIAGGWNFYSIQIPDFLNDYPKFGIWPDGLYMSANLFTYGAGSSFQGVRVWAFDKAQMYAGSPTVKVVTFNVGGGDFTIIPSNARLQTGTPPAGEPNMFVSTWLFLNALTVYKFHVDWNDLTISTFTGPDTPLAATSWPNASVPNAPQPGTAETIDVLQIRAMVQNHYTNFGGTESLWVPHTVRRQNTTGFAAPRWYQVNVTGGTVAAALPQATTWDPDGANVNYRFVPSLALDRAGNLAMGYSVSNATTQFPSMKYAGRLAGDPVNTFSQTEQTFFTGTASQTGSTRWGDYTAMTLDPDGCTFWYTSEYANPADQTFNHRWLTKFGNITPFPGCTPVGAGGTVSGTVTTNPGGNPITGATVQLGARSTTTDGSGNYSFPGIPAGTYPSMIASMPGFISGSASSIVVTDGGTTTENFSLSSAPTSACPTDTTQADFLTGVPTNVDLNTSPGDVMLTNAPTIDQKNTAGTSTGTGFGTPNWTGQTFIPAVTGQLVKADVQLFCNGCGATPPNLTLSVRATSGGLPTGADLSTATVPGSAFASGSIATFTATFGTPATLTSGTQYALILHPVTAPSGSGYFWIRSSPSTYANGSRVLSPDSGTTWSADTTRDFNFKTYMQTGYAPSGNLVSSAKDANPATGITPIWSTLSWNASVPANTSVEFQVAGSNNVGGPFNFIGPDGTAATFFTTSPASLAEFYGFRYIEYKAILATTDGTVTPVLNDATVCFNDVDCSGVAATITPTPTEVCANSAGNTASGPGGMTSYAWGIANGTITSSTTAQTITYTAGASGTVTLTLTVVAPNGCNASSSTPITIDPLPSADIIISNTQTVTVNGSTGSFTLTFSGQTTSILAFNASAAQVQAALNALSNIGGAGGSTTVSLLGNVYTVTFGGTLTGPQPEMTGAGSDGATVVVNAAGVCDSSTGNQAAAQSGASTYAWTITNGTITNDPSSQFITWTAGPSGTVTLNLTVTGPTGCTVSSAPATVPLNDPPPTPTISADTNGTGTQDQACPEVPLTLHANGATGAVSYTWYKDIDVQPGQTTSTYSATGAATYYVTATDANGCTSAQSAGYVVQNPTPHSPFISFRNQDSSVTTLAICQGTSQIIDSDSATGIQWYKDGVAIPGAGSQSYTATQAGVYTAQLDALGCHSQFGRNVTITVDAMPPTPTISGDTNGTGTQDQACPEQPLTLHANGATGAQSYQWYNDNAPIGDGTDTLVVTYVANVTVTATNGSCTTPRSATYVVQNPTPHSPFISFRNQSSSVTSLAICQGQSQIIDSDSATGIQWYKDGVAIPGAGSQSYTATQSGVYTAQLDALGCHSQFGRNVTLTVNPLPATPTATPGGPTTFCQGGSVTLTSSSATGNQWKLNGSPIGGATNQTYDATASGSYTVTFTDGNGCTATSAPTTVTVNPPPATPTIGASGPTSFCAGGSVTLTSSSASGNQWFQNGVSIGGQTGQTYLAVNPGDYSVQVTDGNGCMSAMSVATTVTVNPNPSASITVASSVVSGSTGNTASVANAGGGATYNWSITNGTITAGTGTDSITFTAGATGTLTLQCTVTTAAGCSDTKSANVTVTPAPPPVTITSVVPPVGSKNGGIPVTINGTGFKTGATVTFDTSAATNVVVVNSTKITAKTPAHAPGVVNVTVTNTDTTSATRTNGYTYVPMQFDPNDDNVVDPSDIFFLVHYLFTAGPSPMGPAGMESGDANGDGVVDPADIFYAINYLYLHGPAPASVPGGIATTAVGPSLEGSITLGQPVLRDGRWFVPVIVSAAPGSDIPQGISLRLRFSEPVSDAVIHRAGAGRAATPAFEISRRLGDTLSYVVMFDPNEGGLALGDNRSAVVAEVELNAPAGTIAVDPAVTMLTDAGGTRKATVANGMLTVSGTDVREKPEPSAPPKSN